MTTRVPIPHDLLEILVHDFSLQFEGATDLMHRTWTVYQAEPRWEKHISYPSLSPYRERGHLQTSQRMDKPQKAHTSLDDGSKG